jgi:hypothetical protein
MRHTWFLVAFLASALLTLTTACQDAPVATQNDPAKQEWVKIFNGENLEGWTVKIAHHEVGDNYADTYRVEDGVLKVVYDKHADFEERFSHIYWHEPLSHYRLLIEYRFTGELMHDAPDYARRNSGVMIHSQAPETMPKDQNFPISVEAQFLGGEGDEVRHTMNVCTPGTEIYMNGALVEAHCTQSTSQTYAGDQWVTVEVEVLGNESVKHLIDGEVVLEYQTPEIGGGIVTGFDPAAKQDGKKLSEGYIGLQGEGTPVEFRRVELLSLTGCMEPTAANYKSYYVNADNSLCE